MPSQTFTVTGMTCEHCVHAVTTEFSSLPGVTAGAVVLAPGAVIVHSERPIDSAAVAASAESRSQVMQLVDVFRGRVVDVAPDSLIIEITGADEKIDSLLETLRPFGVLEVAKTGCLAMSRGVMSRVTPAQQTGAADHAVEAGVSFSV